MKNSLINFLSTAVLLVFSSCVKSQDQVPVHQLTITAVNPMFRTTTVDGINVLWTNSDEIAIFAGTNDESSAVFTTSLSSPSSVATFTRSNTVDPVKQGNYYQAVFPASQVYKWNSAGNKACAADIPFDQKVTSPGWDKRASLMAASSATDEFVFTHCVAYLRFTIDASSPDIVSFSATSGAGELVASRVTLVINDDNTVSVTEKTPAGLQSQTATLSMENGAAFPHGTYYLAVLPKVYSDGFIFTFKDSSGNTIEQNISGSLNMKPGFVGSLGIIKNNESGSVIDPLNPFDIFSATRVGIIGDSISTMPDWIPSEYVSYYPQSHPQTGETVDSAEQTYWYKLIFNKMSNAILDRNISFSGTCVTRCNNPDPVESAKPWYQNSFCTRFINKGFNDPDVIIIFGGTNDCNANRGIKQAQVTLLPNSGFEPYSTDYDYAAEIDKALVSVCQNALAATTRQQLEALEDRYFVHAYVKLLSLIRQEHPEAKVVMLVGDCVSEPFRQAILKIAAKFKSLYGYRCVDFQEIEDYRNTDNVITKINGSHPDENGFEVMASYIYQKVGSYIDPQAN